jgi:zinc transport system ATP-binding protein
MTTPMPPMIRVDNLVFTYPGSTTPALDRITLDIDPGSIVGLIGPNGGGKTTLVRLLVNQLKPTSGSIVIDGLTPARAIAGANVIGYLPQHPARLDRFPLSVRQTVRLGLVGKTGLGRSFSKSDLDFVEDLLDRVGVTAIADDPMSTLSGGQAQRVFIARAVAARPKILLLDEPTVGVDRVHAEQFITLLQSLKTQLNLTVVMVSHDLRAVAAIADRIACLNCTIHYHDVPEKMPPDVVYRMFACDLQATGLGGPHQGCGDVACTQEHVAV